MPEVMLAAEADQIQDFIFRASRLREVVGGSQLLTRFCEQGASALLFYHGADPSRDLIVNDGGAFRIRFESEYQATAFGHDLAELYRRTTGCNLTVAKPVVYDASDFRETSKKAQAALREAKSQGDAAATSPHTPFMALCASCGIALATERYAHHSTQPQNYYCVSCRQKDIERQAEVRSLRRQADPSSFLGAFLDAVQTACQGQSTAVDVPNQFPQDAEDVAAFDLTGRRYVAYLLADGNRMGSVFSSCRDEETLKGLSQALTDVLRSSLAEPCPELLGCIAEKNHKRLLPVLPLILGGDDLFALLPAPWALDVATRFCQAYERRLRQALDSLSLDTGEMVPTVAAAVVICKANYPHALAHRQGERLLQEAKRLVRGLEVETQGQHRVSAVNIAMITGNEAGAPDELEASPIRMTASPFFVHEEMPPELRDVGLSVQHLQHHRRVLEKAALPAKRLAEFEYLFDQASKEMLDAAIDWLKEGGDALLERIGHRGDEQRRATLKALVALGGEEFSKEFYRPFQGGFRGTGFTDLLHLWHYAHGLDAADESHGE